MLTHYPDKPITQNPCFLQEWDDKGTYLCQQKVDGWRLIIIRDKQGKFHYLSRHNKGLADDILPELKAEIETLAIPNDSQIDGEWISRRACSMKDKYRLPEMIFLFDVLKWKGMWQLNKPLDERYALVKKLFVGKPVGKVLLPPEAEPGKFVEFFEAQRMIDISEGVVVKHLKSKIEGDRRECKTNKMMYKVKYRAGSSGETDMAQYQADLRVGRPLTPPK